MDNMNQDIECGNYDWVVKGFERVVQQLHEWIKSIDKLLLCLDRLFKSLFVLLAGQYKTLQLQCFLQTLKSKVCEDTPANLLCLLL